MCYGILKHPNCTHLLAHGLRVGDCGTEEAVPLDPSVQTRPVVVSVASVRQTPGYQSIVLSVHRVTGLASRTAAHTAQRASRRLAVLLVVVSVLSATVKVFVSEM